MPSQPTKRAAADSQPAGDRDGDNIEYEPIQITCQFHETLHKFPQALRQVIESQYTDTIYEMLEACKGSPPAPQQSTYHIISGVSGSSASDYKVVQNTVFPWASMANVAVLEQFSRKLPPRKIRFVQAPDELLDNPDYAGLNAVAAGQVGWGFDRRACLSLHKTAVEGGRLRHDFIYVVRREVDVVARERVVVTEGIEVDDECAIVEDPRIAKE